MKAGIHPDYRDVVFQDVTSEFKILTRSTLSSKETVKWEDGNEYPLIKVDISSATDIHGTPLAAGLTPEDVNTDFAALGVTLATSTVVFSNEQTPAITVFKLEGLAILNANQVAISNDNDFGIGDFPGAISRMWVIRLEDNLPVAPAQ